VNNPRTRIRRLVTETLEEQEDANQIESAVIDRIMQDPYFTETLIRSLVHKEVQEVVASQEAKPASIKPAISREPVPILPSMKQTGDIILNVSKMRKLDLIPLAEELERESDVASEAAAFVRAVEDLMDDTNTVGERFDMAALMSIKSRVTFQTTRKVFIGQRQIPIKGVLA
jgi:hypothetical protein